MPNGLSGLRRTIGRAITSYARFHARQHPIVKGILSYTVGHPVRISGGSTRARIARGARSTGRRW